MQVLMEKGADGEPLQSSEKTTRTGAHEYGHSIGLEHGTPSNKQLTSKKEPNLMNQTVNTNSTKVKVEQLEKAKKVVLEKQQ